ncbi:glycoside hydrolase family 16 protein [Glaciecola petra]|uniref:Glycoside hydrolase family 16 protein n=1 Tax=Glaciecola petra TaxID=3075602 RepID=A0ABU2ZQN8_9ALTE|nr:glycoside hydrolase family 16 protein [Aestuariibacter sp. P117]MDT0594581.1 glycoside hydrolase family 16 protein [Aestuariibacter sp. P117]
MIKKARKNISLRFESKIFTLLFCIMAAAFSKAGWEVAWIETFDGDGVNWNNWTAQTQANYNNEIQCYTDDDTSADRNYEVSDGTLKIIARKQNINCPGQNGAFRTWTSGRLNSKDKAEFLYGRIEARLRFLELKGGTWPAFWMLENRISEQPIKGDNDNVNWPNPGAGEIDVWEWYANQADRYITNFFNAANCGAEQRIPYPGGSPDVTDFQTYGIEWTKDNIKFFMNDQVVAEHDLSNCPQYEESMFVLLNVAIGGTLGGSQDPTLDEATMEVDYVAHCVASEANDWQQCNESTPKIADDDGDGVSNATDECPNTPNGATVNAVGCQIKTEPDTAAPKPVIPDGQVISLFSDEYRNIDPINYNPNWNQATRVTVVDIEGNTTLKYENLNYQGTDFENSKQDVTEMKYLHVDYWVPFMNELKLFLISPGPVEVPFNFDVKEQSWQSVAIPLTAFNGVDLTNTFQLKIEGSGTVYLDNIFFSAEAEANVAPRLSLSVVQGTSTNNNIVSDGGTVTITAEITDDNEQDTHSLEWSVTGTSNFTSNNMQLTFDPEGLTATEIIVSAVASDNGNPVLSADASITLPLSQPAPAPVVPPVIETPAAETSGGGGSLGIFYLMGVLVVWFARYKANTKG